MSEPTVETYILLQDWMSTMELRFERRIDGVRIVNILQRRWIREVAGKSGTDGRPMWESEWRDIPVVDSPEVAAANAAAKTAWGPPPTG